MCVGKQKMRFYIDQNYFCLHGCFRILIQKLNDNKEINLEKILWIYLFKQTRSFSAISIKIFCGALEYETN